MAVALSRVKDGSLSAYKASQMFNIPKTTLLDKMKKKYQNDYAGRPTILTKHEEKLIVKWILFMAEIGFPVTKDILLHSVSKLVVELNRQNGFKDGLSGRHWYEGFMKRNPATSKRIGQTLIHARINANEDRLRAWFKRVYDYFKSNEFLDVLEDPSRIFNADESAFFLCPKGDAVLAKKGAKRVYSRTGNDDKECLTLLVGASANFKLMPILALFPYKRIPKNILSKYPKKWSIGKTDSGWMTAESFYEYIANGFNPFLEQEKIKKPVALFLDGHVSHISLQVCEFAKEHGIILTALLPHSTHILQPMDVAVFRSLKSAWAKDVRSWRMSNNGARIKREAFGPILQNSIGSSINAEMVANGFRKCGLYPFDANAIDYSSLVKTNTSIARLPRSASPQALEEKEGNAFVELFEKHLGAKKLNDFQGHADIWTGDIRDENLFYFWKSLREKRSSTLTIDIGDATFKANHGCDGDFSFIFENTMLNDDGENLEIESALTKILSERTPERTSERTPERSPERLAKDLFPTPFKNAFLWPDPSSQIQSSNRKIKKTIPTVATAEEYIKHLKRVNDEKQEKKDKVDERRKAREMKKKDGIQILKKKCSVDSISPGDYVSATYEGEKYPGLVLECIGKKCTQYKVKTMHMVNVVKNKIQWKWPEEEDILLYAREDISKIDVPKESNKSGVFSFEKL